MQVATKTGWPSRRSEVRDGCTITTSLQNREVGVQAE